MRNVLESGSGDGFEPVFLGGGVGAGGTVVAHVIDKAEGGVAEFGGTLDEGLWRGRAAEEGEGGFGEEFHGSFKGCAGSMILRVE